MKRRLRSGLWLLAALLARGTGIGAETPSPELGLQVGQHAPPFTLKAQNGKEVSLESVLKEGPVAVVFYRSAEWCLACQLQLIKLQKNLDEIQATGGRVIGISFDSVEKIRDFASRRDIKLPLLSDAGSKTIDAYKVRDSRYGQTKDGVSAHAIFIIDQDCIIRSKMLSVIYDERPGIDALVKALTQARNSNGVTKR